MLTDVGIDDNFVKLCVRRAQEQFLAFLLRVRSYPVREIPL